MIPRSAAKLSIVRIAPAIRDTDRMLLVEADVPNQGGLRAGLFARAQIIVNPGEPALSIPPNALSAFAGIEKVVVVRDGKAAEEEHHPGVVENPPLPRDLLSHVVDEQSNAEEIPQHDV